MTALELVRRHPDLDLTPVLRVVKYTGLDSDRLSDRDVEVIRRLHGHFVENPELVVGTEPVCERAGLDAERLRELLSSRRREIPFLGSVDHPMVPLIGIRMIRAAAGGKDPMEEVERKLLTLSEVSKETGISLTDLARLTREHDGRIPSQDNGGRRMYPEEALDAFRQLAAERAGRRGSDNGDSPDADAGNRRAAAHLDDLEEEIEDALRQLDKLSRSLGRLSRKARRARRGLGAQASPNGKRRGGARRSGEGRPDTIVAACRKILEAATAPMKVAEVTERVLEMDLEIRAKNPNVTVSSILSSYDMFRRVKRGYYELDR